MRTVQSSSDTDENSCFFFRCGVEALALKNTSAKNYLSMHKWENDNYNCICVTDFAFCYDDIAETAFVVLNIIIFLA